MKMKMITPILAMVAGLAAPAMAQPATATTAAPAAEKQAWTPSWSDDSIAKVAGMLSGTWRTSSPVGDDSGEGQTDIVMSVAPVQVTGLSDALYVETARADRMWEPYRQAIFQLYRYKGNVRLRTYEFKTSDESRAAFTGLTAAPEIFPTLSRDDLIATLDVELHETAGGFEGATPYPYPTGVGGAVEMTSNVTLTPTSFTTADRGYDAKGNVVWGASEGSAYTFKRAAGLLTAKHLDKGVIVIDFVNPGEEVIKEGDRVHTHYTGWLATGGKFDSSRDRGRPFIFTYPSPPGRMIEGWDVGLTDLSVGARRKVYLPWAVAYGDRGNPAAGIPAQADLVFDIECLLLEHPEPPAAEPGEGAEGAAAGSGDVQSED